MSSENSANYLVPYDERVAKKAKKIRCNRCGRPSFAELTICPSCGRNLRAARSRWITRGIPWGLAALLCLSIWLFSGRSPLDWITDVSKYAADFAINLGTRIEPRVTNPENVLNQSQGILQPNMPTENVSTSFTIITPVSNEPLNAGSQDSLEQPAAEQRLADQNADNQAGPQSAADSIALLMPTLTSSPLPTVTREQVAATTPTPASTIAPTAVPTIVPTATNLPTPEPPKPTDTPTPENLYRVSQVILKTPLAGAILDCGRDNTASWITPASVAATDRYVLNLGYVSNQTADQYVVTWIAKERFSSEKTSWVLDPAYCKLSLDQFNNQWVWTMQVVDEDGNSVSEPSRASYFVWRKPS